MQHAAFNVFVSFGGFGGTGPTTTQHLVLAVTINQRSFVGNVWCTMFRMLFFDLRASCGRSQPGAQP